MKKVFSFLLITLIGFAAFAACDAKSTITKDGIEINQAHIYLPAAGSDGHSASDVASAYMVIENMSGTDDQLIGVACDFAIGELHTMVMDGDMMKMTPVGSFDVPNQGGLILESGGNHIMFIDLRGNIKVGDEKEVVLNFENAGQVVVPMLVTAEK